MIDKINIDRKNGSISIWNGKLMLTKREAVQLMELLNAHASELYDLEQNYYYCQDCGQTHHNPPQKTCPNSQEE